MLVTLGIKHTRRMRSIVICGLPDCTLLFFFHVIVSNGTILGENLAARLEHIFPHKKKAQYFNT